MADLVIKPSSGNLVLKDDQNAEKFKIATSSGNITHTGNIALGTITEGTFPAGHVINVATNTFSTRTVYGGCSGGAHTALITAFNYNKTVAGSTLYLHSTIPMHACSAGDTDTGFKYGSSAVVNCGAYGYTEASAELILIVAGILAGHTTTGSQSVVVGCSSANSTTTKPAEVICPNSTDDARLTQKLSLIHI